MCALRIADRSETSKSLTKFDFDFPAAHEQSLDLCGLEAISRFGISNAAKLTRSL